MSSSGKKIPKSLKECYATDNVSSNLLDWCERIEKWGRFLFVFLIISGLIIAITSSITVREVTKGIYYTYTETETSFDSALFITSIIQTAIYAFLEYWVYHILSLLIASLATIVQNTRITANVALYNVAKKEGTLKEAVKSTSSASNHKRKEDMYTEEDFLKDIQKETPQKLNDFLTEIEEMETADLELILKDQRDLYSEEEMDLIEKELSTRKNNI